ncbi:recombination protein RecR [candidate division WWE3 bacterium CG06_land_8_20_14_3_00_42_16]|uniref:Recombination protein RecR n=3 Tax=Katanobacteria TaxID=422282 RepID=A0A2M7ALU1_UNCKA|nr:MAG: recombination protein RecR [candidate division WWE3 bacterium CG06_land_8_20_14_3_00_42_16]PIZ41986.1 MAG: recombination protein RecR [candidate division WWE3 bacterium CG_4_10_14_0_2_um_filter_42_8]PJC69455.1 MAG: recombination protein RecR [candidate division WWE3 bacterium CG_4_8_14_3_um_filter_42_11]
MRKVAKPIQDLVEYFEKLPGIGPKTAQRLTYYLIHMPEEEVINFAQAILDLRKKTVMCSTCFNIAETDPCAICKDEDRERDIVCIVEDPLDVLALEKAGFAGLYHVLHGVVSPLNNIGPEDLKIRELLPRLKSGEVKEIILATNPNMEGEATAMYIQRLINPLGIKITRIARGLPVGGDLEYADEVTLSRALEGRKEF